MFNCKIFSDLIVAVTVPCGNTICNTHIKNYKDKFGCQCCKRQHEVPNNNNVSVRIQKLVSSMKSLFFLYFQSFILKSRLRKDNLKIN